MYEVIKNKDIYYYKYFEKFWILNFFEFYESFKNSGFLKWA